MWLFVMFELPVKDQKARKRYAQFRKSLIHEGFSRVQLSVYARYYGCEDSSDTQRRAIAQRVPDNGRVRLVAITDHQFGKMESYYGKNREANEEQPKQLMLF